MTKTLDLSSIRNLKKLNPILDDFINHSNNNYHILNMTKDMHRVFVSTLQPLIEAQKLTTIQVENIDEYQRIQTISAMRYLIYRSDVNELFLINKESEK